MKEKEQAVNAKRLLRDEQGKKIFQINARGDGEEKRWLNTASK